MLDAFVRFEREGRDGLVAVGSCLSDVFNRFGVRIENECEPSRNVHFCSVVITEGSELLSELTGIETEHFAENGRRTNERFASEAIIIKPGEIVIMTDEKREESKRQVPKKDKFQEEFKQLSLEEKIKALLKMEAMTLQETFSYGLNESMKAADRLGDVLAEFGRKIEVEFRKATHRDQNATPKSKAAK